MTSKQHLRRKIERRDKRIRKLRNKIKMLEAEKKSKQVGRRAAGGTSLCDHYSPKERSMLSLVTEEPVVLSDTPQPAERTKTPVIVIPDDEEDCPAPSVGLKSLGYSAQKPGSPRRILLTIAGELFYLEQNVKYSDFKRTAEERLFTGGKRELFYQAGLGKTYTVNNKKEFKALVKYAASTYPVLGVAIHARIPAGKNREIGS